MNSKTRKIFRFKYEPCEGTCYAWCDSLTRELRKLDEIERQNIVRMMVDAHNKLCDNPDYSFGIDESNIGVFVAHFRTPETTGLYVSNNFLDCVKDVCSAVLSADIPSIKGMCNFGTSGAEDLGKEILKWCQDEMQEELAAKHCECKVS